MSDLVYDPIFKQWVPRFPEPEPERPEPEPESIEDWARGIYLRHKVNRQKRPLASNRRYDPIFGQWCEPNPEPEPVEERQAVDPILDWARARIKYGYTPLHLRYNENHDELGRFAESDSSGGGDSASGGAGGKSSGAKESKDGAKTAVPPGTPIMPGHPSMEGKTPGTITDADIDTMADTLVDRYESCSQEMKDAGAAWYPDASDMIADVADANGFTKEQGIAIAAALSPGTKWEPDNIMQACQFMSKYGNSPNANPDLKLNFSGRSTHTNIERALKVMNEKDPIAALSGPKITSFAANLMGDNNRVTIDTWASRAAANASDHVAKNLIAGKGYDKFAEAYSRAAAKVGVSPSAMQATVWLHIKK